MTRYISLKFLICS